MGATRSAVVRALPEQEKARLFERAVRRSLGPGEILHLAGDPARRIHIVEAGILKLSTRDGDGRETILGLAAAGDVVGEVAALHPGGHATDAVAVGRCAVVGIDADLFLAAIGRHAVAALELARVLAARNRLMSETALERTSADVRARMARGLLDLADLLGQESGAAIDLDLPLNQEDLGRLAGMCRESACKTLRAFKKRGLVDYRGRKLRILCPEALEEIKCAGRAEEPFP